MYSFLRKFVNFGLVAGCAAGLVACGDSGTSGDSANGGSLDVFVDTIYELG